LALWTKASLCDKACPEKAEALSAAEGADEWEGSGLVITSRIEYRVSSIEYFQSKTLIPRNKNQNFQKFFNLLSQTELRQSLIDIRGLFSHQKCR
jgi:hypothetical protein